jgi:hypothetical protein
MAVTARRAVQPPDLAPEVFNVATILDPCLDRLSINSPVRQHNPRYPTSRVSQLALPVTTDTVASRHAK